jgi:hypothetical protein
VAPKRQQAEAARKKLDDLVQTQQKPAEARLAAATQAVTDATAANPPSDEAVAQAQQQKAAAEQDLANINNQVAAATAAFEAAQKAAMDAETAAANAKAAADAARAAQVAADKAVPETRRLADAARLRRDRAPTAERAAATKAAEATRTVAAVKQAAERGNISLKADTPPRGITVKAANIAADKNETTVTVAVTNQAPVAFRHNVVLIASLRAGQDTFTGVVPAIPIKVVAPPK